MPIFPLFLRLLSVLFPRYSQKIKARIIYNFTFIDKSYNKRIACYTYVYALGNFAPDLTLKKQNVARAVILNNYNVKTRQIARACAWILFIKIFIQSFYFVCGFDILRTIYFKFLYRYIKFLLLFYAKNRHFLEIFRNLKGGLIKNHLFLFFITAYTHQN